jgi:CubicO group peptidase (beta-lactamase class C family)
MHKNKCRLSWWGAFIAFGYALTANATNVASIDDIINQYKSRGLLSGTLLVDKSGKRTQWNIGLANDSTQVPNGNDTIFLIASDSKAFVAAAIMKLVDEGKLKLSDTLHSFIPEYPRRNLRWGNTEVTLFNLLTHTSGAPEAYETKTIEKRINKTNLTFEDMLNSIKKKSLKFKPGSRFLYLNTGYLLLGEVVHRVSGMPYHEFLRQNFFTPLGLDHTSVGPPTNTSDSVARSYEVDNGARVDYRTKYNLGPLAASDVFADTNIYTDAGDFATWTIAATSGQVVSESSTAQMLTPHLEDYGFGWIVFNDSSGRLAYEHAGDYGDFQSWTRRYPQSEVTVIWLGNQGMRKDSDLDSFIESVCNSALNLR